MDSIIARIAPLIIQAISPEIRTMVEEFVSKIDTKAQATPNPWDDMFAAVLKSATGMK